MVAFDDFVVDPRRRRLWHAGREVSLQDKPFDLLLALLRRPGELVPREELYEMLWPEAEHLDFEAGLNAAVRKLRHALGDDAQEPRFVETVPRKGYRFLAETRPHVGVVARSRSRLGRRLGLAGGLLMVVLAASLLMRTPRADPDPVVVEEGVVVRARADATPRLGIMPLGRGLEGPAAEPWDRLGEEILVTIADSGFEVLGPRWTARYNGMPFPDLVRVREELDLDYLLNGRPLPDGSGFLLELIRLDDGVHPWVQILQAPAATAVLESLRVSLEEEASKDEGSRGDGPREAEDP